MSSRDGAIPGARAATKENPAATATPPEDPQNEPFAAELELSSPNVSRSAPLYVRWATYLLAYPAIALATSAFGVLSLICSLWDRFGRQQHRIAQAWARTLLRITLSPVRVVYPDRLGSVGTAVFAANHLSYMDTPVLFAKLPFQFRILAKQALWKLPFIGWHLRRSGQVAVDQTSARSSIASLSRGVTALTSGMPLVLFPEGGRSAAGTTQQFLAGAAFMAIRAQVPLVPLTLVGTYELLPIHTYHLRPRPLLLIVGEPLSTAGLTTRDADALTQTLFRVITETYLHFADPPTYPDLSDVPGRRVS